MTTLRRTVHGREVYSFEELVKGIGPDAVASPRRSTVPLVDYWRDPELRLRDLWDQLHVRQPGDTTCISSTSYVCSEAAGSPRIPT